MTRSITELELSQKGSDDAGGGAAMIYGILVVVLIGILVLLGRDVAEKVHAARCTHVSNVPTLSALCADENAAIDQVHLPPMPPPVITITVRDEIRVMG